MGLRWLVPPGAAVALLALVTLQSLSAIAHAAYTPLNPDVDWVAPRELSQKFLRRNTKPIIYIIHKSWCPACEFMRKQFADSSAGTEFIRASKSVVMVDAGDDNEPTGEGFAPDGGYYPRVIVCDPKGRPLQQFKCVEGCNPSYLYSYYYPRQLLATLRAVKEAADAGAFGGPRMLDAATQASLKRLAHRRAFLS